MRQRSRGADASAGWSGSRCWCGCWIAPDGARSKGQMEESDFAVKWDDGKGKVIRWPKPHAPRWDSQYRNVRGGKRGKLGKKCWRF